MSDFNEKYKIVSCKEDREKIDEIDELSHMMWPEFMMKDPVANENWMRLYDDFPEFQFAVVERETNRAIAQANTVPFYWDAAVDELPDEGWDWVFKKAIDDYRAGITPNIMSLLQIAILPEYQGQRLSPGILAFVKSLGAKKRLLNLVAPVRPNLKHKYPLIDIGDYIKWTDDNDLPFDPWLRVHVKSGARIIKPCRKAMTIPGKITDWESWTDMKFPQSGEYVVPLALNPVNVDREIDRAVYIEPNVWVAYDLSVS